MSQPMSRVESASVCSEPKSPGGSSGRSAIIICTGMRLPEMGEYSSYANGTPTPELPVKTRAPLDEAPCAMLSCECSLLATIYSASSSPLATICASAIIVAVYGRIGYAVITSTSAYFAACADATQPLIRTVFFLSRTVAITWAPRIASDLFRRQVGQLPQLLGLTSVQSLRDRERRVHPDDAGVEVELRHAFEAARRTLLDADAAAFAVIDQDLVEAVRSHRTRDARLGTHQITVVARVAGAAAEAAVRFLDRLLLAERKNHFLLRLLARRGLEHRLLHAGEVREVRHVHASEIGDDVERDRAGLERLAVQHLVQVERDALAVADRVDDHQLHAGAELRDVARGEHVRVA